MTTPNIEGRKGADYLGLVTGEAIMGANLFRDLFATIRDVVGGQAGAYEKVLKDARDVANADMTAEAKARDAVALIGVDLDYETVGSKGSMLMVTASGTAVRTK